MGRRLAGLQTLGWRDRFRLAACIGGLTVVHGCLALIGYARTRRIVEVLSHRSNRRAAAPEDIEQARVLARLAAVAGSNGPIAATCLRQSLLLLGWLRLRGLRPILHLGVNGAKGSFLAHAWVEVEGIRLRERDAGYHRFH